MDYATHPPASGGRPSTLFGGQVLAGRYRVAAFLGRGSWGEVYEAEDLELGDRIAVKILRPEAGDERLRQRFKQEIQLARRVTHLNVCRTYDLVYHYEEGSQGSEGNLWVLLTMELLRGETLADRLARKGRMTPGEALPVVCQIAAALAAAHAAGVVHRDLKSANVFLVESPAGTRAVVNDFGLAWSAGEEGSAAPAHEGELVGTPAYMAPEQVRGEVATPATDVYALGVVLYEMVTGELPFVGPTAFYTALKRLHEPPPPPRGKVPGLDPVWEEVILRCLEREPAGRFATPDDVIGALAAEAPAARRPRAAWAGATACLMFLLTGALALLSPQARTGAPAALAPTRPRPAASSLQSERYRLTEALARERERGDLAAEAKTQQELARLATLQGDLAGALRFYRRASLLLRAAGNRRGLAAVLQSIAAASFELGDPEGARGPQEEALALAQRDGDREGIARALHGLANLDRLAGDLAAAERKYEQAFTLYGALRQPARQACMLHEIGRLYVLRHEPERALEVLGRALALCGGPGHCPIEAAVLNDVATARWTQGNAAAARADYERSLALSRAAHEENEEARALVGLGESLTDLGNPQAAQAPLAAALAIFHRHGNRNRETMALSGMARALAAAGDYEGALHKHEETRALRLEIGERLNANESLLDIAELALAHDHLAQAAGAAREAARVFRELGVPEGEAEAASVLARCRAVRPAVSF
jgi:tetratricopeptide (TPR) repeat protein/tRNA A-37 threonylcarbamoyl transferase component Bud32